MASLRARLVAGLLALAAAGMLILAGVTYAEQHHFLYDRIDSQARQAPQAVAHSLHEDGDQPASTATDGRRSAGPGRTR